MGKSTINGHFQLLSRPILVKSPLILGQADIPCDSRAFGRKSTCCNAEESSNERTELANLIWIQNGVQASVSRFTLRLGSLADWAADFDDLTVPSGW